MSEDQVVPVRDEVAAKALCTEQQYFEMYQRSVDDPEGFWAEQAEKFLTWSKPWDRVLDYVLHYVDLLGVLDPRRRRLRLQ